MLDLPGSDVVHSMMFVAAVLPTFLAPPIAGRPAPTSTAGA